MVVGYLYSGELIRKVLFSRQTGSLNVLPREVLVSVGSIAATAAFKYKFIQMRHFLIHTVSLDILHEFSVREAVGRCSHKARSSFH